jgi:hypothetical protein
MLAGIGDDSLYGFLAVVEIDAERDMPVFGQRLRQVNADVWRETSVK